MLIGQDAVVAMRFFDSAHMWHILPVRQATVTGIDAVEGLHLISFTLGPFFSLPTSRELADACLVVPQGEQSGLGRDVIFFESALDPVLPVATADERAHWTALTNAYARTTLPLHQGAKRAVFVRVDPPASDADAATIADFKDVGREWAARAYALKEGQEYALPFDYRVPSLVGGNAGFKGLAYALESHDDAVAGSPRLNRLTSNYDQLRPRIKGLRPSKRVSTIELVPSGDSVVASDGMDIFAFPIPLHVGVVKDYAYRARNRWLPTLVLWILLFLALVITRSLSAPEGTKSVFSPGTLLLLAAAAGVAIAERWLDAHLKS